MGKNRRGSLRIAERAGRHVRRPRVEALEDRCLLATFTVVNTDDAGPGSLREAITQANLDPAQDTIEFAPGVTGAITLQSALPDLATAIVLEGPGASALT